jgi:hypothetical protein
MAADEARMDSRAPVDRSMGGETSQSGGMSDMTGQAKQAMTQTAQETVETAKNAGMEIADTVQQQVSQVVDQAVSQTADTVVQVKEQASSVFVDQRDRATAALSGLADALRETGRTLAQKAESADGAQAPATAIAPFIEEIADRLSQSSEFLKEKDVSQLISEAENLARKQPMLFVGALFGVGLVGARLLKGTLGSSNDESSKGGQQSQSQSQPQQSADWNAGTGWTFPDQSASQTSSDATTFSSQVASNVPAGRGVETYDTGMNANQSSVYGSNASNVTGKSS